MDKLNMNNTKHHEKINTHTQITKNTIQRSGLLFFFRKGNICAARFGTSLIFFKELKKEWMGGWKMNKERLKVAYAVVEMYAVSDKQANICEH